MKSGQRALLTAKSGAKEEIFLAPNGAAYYRTQGNPPVTDPNLLRKIREAAKESDLPVFHINLD